MVRAKIRKKVHMKIFVFTLSLHTFYFHNRKHCCEQCICYTYLYSLSYLLCIRQECANFKIAKRFRACCQKSMGCLNNVYVLSIINLRRYDKVLLTSLQIRVDLMPLGNKSFASLTNCSYDSIVRKAIQTGSHV